MDLVARFCACSPDSSAAIQTILTSKELTFLRRRLSGSSLLGASLPLGRGRGRHASAASNPVSTDGVGDTLELKFGILNTSNSHTRGKNKVGLGTQRKSASKLEVRWLKESNPTKPLDTSLEDGNAHGIRPESATTIEQDGALGMAPHDASHKINKSPETSTNQKSVQEPMKSYSREEVACHWSDDSCWVIIDDVVYDVTGFLAEHPAGSEIILEHGGRDASSAFQEVGHSSGARDMLRTFQIGVLAED